MMQSKKASTFFNNFVDIAGGVIFVVLGLALIFLGSSSTASSIDDQLEVSRTPYATIDFLNKLVQTPITLDGETKLYGEYLSEYVALRDADSSLQKERLGDVAAALRLTTQQAQDQDLSRISVTVHEYFGSTKLESYTIYGSSSDTQTEDNTIALPYYESDAPRKKTLYLQASFADDRFKGGDK